MRVVVIGNGMAGSRFVAELTERDPGRTFSVTVVGEESDDAYNRALLSNVIAGNASPCSPALLQRASTARAGGYT
jgi:assimilatory nitrate reductase electron transfer subunit